MKWQHRTSTIVFTSRISHCNRQEIDITGQDIVWHWPDMTRWNPQTTTPQRQGSVIFLEKTFTRPNTTQHGMTLTLKRNDSFTSKIRRIDLTSNIRYLPVLNMENAQKAQPKLVLFWCRKQKNGSKIDSGQKSCSTITQQPQMSSHKLSELSH